MIEWQNKELIKDGDIGFVYIIKHKTTGEFYIGKKNLFKYKTINKKKVYSNSDWITYLGSNKEFLDYISIKGDTMFEKIILGSYKSSIQVTYNEMKYQILYDWTSEKCFNQNILGKFFKNRII